MKAHVDVVLGEEARLVGEIHFVADGNRQSSSFAYDKTWLEGGESFAIDPHLPLQAGHQFPQQQQGSAFFGCFADSEPDGWGRKVIQRDRRMRGLAGASSSLDFLLAVHDESRIGALRFRDDAGIFQATPEGGLRSAPPLIELKELLNASSAVDRNTETAADLRLLLGRGSPPGGMRPKCTVIEEDGTLAIAKFPSATDEREVVRGEALALVLARRAGINAARGRVVLADGVPVVVIRRFDRKGRQRLMYASARTFLGAIDESDHAYTEFAEALRRSGAAPNDDIEELWRRIVFNILITNVDDHLINHGFLHAGRGQWTLAPAFDLNPAPDRAREFKVWITEAAGPSASIVGAMGALKPFGIPLERGRQILKEVESAVSGWRKAALSPQVGMKAAQADLFRDAFEHAERTEASKVLSSVGPIVAL